MAADGAASGSERGGPWPAAPAPQTLLAGCVLSAARDIASVGTIVVFNVPVCSSVSTSDSTGVICKKTVVYTRVNGASHIENCKNYKKVITHQHIA